MDESTVTYTVKELIGDLKDAMLKGFASLDAKLDDDVTRLEKRVEQLETKAAQAAALVQYKRWLLGGGIFGVAGFAASVITLLARFH